MIFLFFTLRNKKTSRRILTIAFFFFLISLTFRGLGGGPRVRRAFAFSNSLFLSYRDREPRFFTLSVNGLRCSVGRHPRSSRLEILRFLGSALRVVAIDPSRSIGECEREARRISKKKKRCNYPSRITRVGASGRRDKIEKAALTGEKKNKKSNATIADRPHLRRRCSVRCPSVCAHHLRAVFSPSPAPSSVPRIVDSAYDDDDDDDDASSTRDFRSSRYYALDDRAGIFLDLIFFPIFTDERKRDDREKALRRPRILSRILQGTTRFRTSFVRSFVFFFFFDGASSARFAVRVRLPACSFASALIIVALLCISRIIIRTASRRRRSKRRREVRRASRCVAFAAPTSPRESISNPSGEASAGKRNRARYHMPLSMLRSIDRPTDRRVTLNVVSPRYTTLFFNDDRRR